MRKTNQHYVFRHYLKAWATGEQVWVHRHGKVFPCNVSKVGVERDFYRLQELTEADITFVQKLGIEGLPPLLTDRCMEFVRMFAFPVALKKALDPADPRYPELRSWLDEQIVNTEEDYHQGIEESLIPALEAMLNGSVEFYSDVTGRNFPPRSERFFSD